MKIRDIFCDTFEALRRQVTPEVRLASCVVPDPLMVTATRSDDSDFCRETVAKGWLSEEQMAHAAERYRLGRSRSGKCIFWMIDELGRVHDGRIGDSWVSMMLRSRKPELLRYWQSSHCLFGLHLLDPLSLPLFMGRTLASSKQGRLGGVSVVEREESAVILSEVLPEQVWMATGRKADFTTDMLLPLRGLPIMVFPPTDPTMRTSSSGSKWPTRPGGSIILTSRSTLSWRITPRRSRKGEKSISQTLSAKLEIRN